MAFPIKTILKQNQMRERKYKQGNMESGKKGKYFK